MSYTFRKAVRTNTSTLIALAGPSGSGKTYSAIRLARGLVGPKGKMVLIDTEAGRALHYADTFDFDHLELQPPFSPENYWKAIDAADKAGYHAIIIDSMSHEWAGDGGCQDIHDAAHERLGGDPATSVLAWRDAKLDHKRMMTHLLQLHSHLLFCLRAEEKIKFEKDKSGKMQIVPQGWMPICEKNFMYEMTVSFLFTDEKPGYGRPVKLQEQHKPFFNLEKPIDEQAGGRLAEWASGGKPRREDGASTGERDTPPKTQQSSDAPAPSHAEADRQIAASDAKAEWKRQLNSFYGTKPEINAMWTQITRDILLSGDDKRELYPLYQQAVKNATGGPT